MTNQLPPCPSSLKTIQHYLKLASDYDARQPVISYWARLYSLQTGMKIDRKSPEAKVLLTGLMDWLETFKKAHTDNEAITNDVAGQALLENEAHKIFIHADEEDRAQKYNKNIVKSFYTAGIMFDVCETFGELTEEVAAMRKYAKWKATYIHNCLKKGEQPVPGPAGGEDPGFEWNRPTTETNDEFSLPPVPGATSTIPPQNNFTQPTPYTNIEPTPVAQPAPISNPYIQPPTIPPPSSGLTLTAEQYSKAQKYCKWAISSIDYEDRKNAIENLHKAITLLSTGQEL